MIFINIFIKNKLNNQNYNYIYWINILNLILNKYQTNYNIFNYILINNNKNKLCLNLKIQSKDYLLNNYNKNVKLNI